MDKPMYIYLYTLYSLQANAILCWMCTVWKCHCNIVCFQIAAITIIQEQTMAGGIISDSWYVWGLL